MTIKVNQLLSKKSRGNKEICTKGNRETYMKFID